MDWAAYYNLRPSLDGRSVLIERALRSSPVNTGLVAEQLDKLVSDAQSPESRDVSPQKVAARLDVDFGNAPSALQDAGRKAIESLRAIQDAPPVQQQRPLSRN